MFLNDRGAPLLRMLHRRAKIFRGFSFNPMRPLDSFDLIAMQQVVPGGHSQHFSDALAAALAVEAVSFHLLVTQ